MTICEGGGDGLNGNELTFSGLLVYSVSVADGFRRLSGRAQNKLVYSIATDRAKVQRMDNFGKDVEDIYLAN